MLPGRKRQIRHWGIPVDRRPIARGVTTATPIPAPATPFTTFETVVNLGFFGV